MEIVDVLLEARNNAADPDRWLRGELVNEDRTKGCAVGHVALVIQANFQYVHLLNEPEKMKFYTCARLLDDAALELFPFFGKMSVVNDKLGHAPMLMVFDHVIRKLKDGGI